MLNEWQQRDLKYIWHPCSQMKDYEELPPIVIERGQGVWLYDVEGNRYLDAISSWWTNLFGHCNKRLNDALKAQADKLEHVIFANFSHKPAIELSQKLVEIAPKGLEKVFFSDDGSTSVEVALKMSFQYHQQKGNYTKLKFACFTNSYHGETLGALSVGSIDLYSKIYKPILKESIEIQGPDCFRCKYHKTRYSCNVECFEEVEKILEKHHKEICAVIIEPIIQCAGGMKIYPPKFLKLLREVCTSYDVHLIADEVAVGFGRTGKMFACEHAGITPDFLCLSKGLTAGYMPLAVTLTTQEIFDAFYADYVELKAFLHSHSYTGNPLACAVALESLKIFEEYNVLKKINEKATYLEELARKTFDNHRFVGEYRQFGFVGAIELVEDKATKKEFDWRKRVGYHIYKTALKKGLLIRPLGNVIYFMPPFVIEKDEIDFMVRNTLKAINQFFGL